MDVDDLAGEVAAELRVEHLHIASEHDEVGFLLAKNRLHLPIGRIFVFWRDGDVMKRNTVGFDNLAMVLVVGNDAGDDEGEILGDVTGE